MNNATLQFDGGVHRVKNGQLLYIAYHITSDEPIDGRTENMYGTTLPEHPDIPTTAIAGEYSALLLGLEFLIDHKFKGKLTVQGDAKAVIDQINGFAKCGKAYITGMRDAAINHLKKFQDTEVIWIPRKENKEADRIGRAAAYAYASASIADTIINAIDSNSNMPKPVTLPLTITNENLLKTAAEKRIIKHYRQLTPQKQRAIEALIKAM